MKRDYYDVLQVGRDASAEDIKRAYRKQAMKYHPDRNPHDRSSESKFKEAAEAYSILSDDQKRAQYDRFGHAAEGAPGFGGFGHADFDLSDALRTFMQGFGGFGDFDPFGEGKRGSRRPRGGDLKLTLPLSLAEIAKGVTKTVKIKRMEQCSDCEGTGGAAGSKPTSCGACGGKGEVRQVSRSFFGQVVNITECPRCRGTGRVIAHPCSFCSGPGVVKKSVEIKVKIPAGVATGNYMTLKEEGNRGPNGAGTGDLVIFFEELEDERFSRHGSDLLAELEISVATAVLGKSVAIPTLDGEATLSIRPGTQSGEVIRVKGKGLPELHGSRRGDILVRVQLRTPTSISRKERELFEQLESLNGEGSIQLRKIQS